MITTLWFQDRTVWRLILPRYLPFLAGAYTVFSEWMNLIWLRSWTYADSMPTLAIGGFKLGVRCDGTR